MRRPVDPLGYSKDTGIFVCRSDPVHQLGRIAAHRALRLGIGHHLLDCGDHFVTDRPGPSGCASRRPDRHRHAYPHTAKNLDMLTK